MKRRRHRNGSSPSNCDTVFHVVLIRSAHLRQYRRSFSVSRSPLELTASWEVVLATESLFRQLGFGPIRAFSTGIRAAPGDLRRRWRGLPPAFEVRLNRDP